MASLPDYNRPTLPAVTAAAMLASPERLGWASLGVSGGAHPEVAQAEEEPSEPAVVTGSVTTTGVPEAPPPMGGDVGRWLRVFWMGTDGNEVAGLATVVQEAQHGHELLRTVGRFCTSCAVQLSINQGLTLLLQGSDQYLKACDCMYHA